MAIQLHRNQVGRIPLGPFLNDTDGKTVLTGLTIANSDIKLWKPGSSSLVNKNSGGATHMANGIYYATLDATDTSNAGSLVVFCHMAGALPVRIECYVENEVFFTEYNFWRNTVFAQAGGTPTTTTIPIAQVHYSDVPLQTTCGAYVGMMVLSLYAMQAVSRVVAYDGLTQTLTVDPPLPHVPSDGDYFLLLPGNPGSVTLADNAIAAANLAADAVAEIQNGLATATALQLVDDLVDELESRLTATRAGYLDNLSGGAVAKDETVAKASALQVVDDRVDDLESRLTAARAGYLDNLNSGVPLSALSVDAILDEVIEGTTTLRQGLRLVLAALAGQSSGGGTATVRFRDLADSKDRITATVDADGNRTAVTRDST